MKNKLLLNVLLICAAITTSVSAEPTRDPEGVGIDQKPGQTVALDTVFTNEQGQQVTLQSFFQDHRKPVVLVPSYFECPRLCTLIYNGVRDVMKESIDKGLVPGEDYTVLAISFNPKDNPTLARVKGRNYRETIKNAEVTPEGWHFLVSDQKNIDKLMDSIGYQFKPDGEKDFSHPAAIILVSPDGTISRYMFGIEFKESDYRLSLIEASAGKIGSPVDAVLLMCFRYDEQSGQYTPYAWGFMKLGSAATVVFLIGLFIFLRLKERNT